MREKKHMNLIGQTFGRLKVIKRDYLSHKDGVRWICKCSCGNTVSESTHSLRKKNGNVLSCGCLRTERQVNSVTKHGLSQSKIYSVWAAMKSRCINSNNKYWERYGGRGIKFCDRWSKFENFYEDMNQGYRQGLQLDRIDNNGNYEPSNCRWVSCRKNNMNKSNNVFVTYKGLRRSFIDWYNDKPRKTSFFYRHKYNGDILIEGGKNDNVIWMKKNHPEFFI